MNQYLYEGPRSTPPEEDAIENAEVVELERLLAGFRHEAPLAFPLPRRKKAPRWSKAATLLAALSFSGACFLLWGRAALEDRRPLMSVEPMAAVSPCALGNAGFGFTAEGGSLHCAGVGTRKGVLPVGQWLEAGQGVTAMVEVTDIGSLTVHNNTRLRLRETSSTRQRIELATGAVSVRVLAPPRLFIVDTPAASAVDLGCAYDIEVDASGRTHLRVTSGAVSLEGQGRASWVPEGHEAIATVERGPGLPLRMDSHRDLREAAERFDAGDALGLRDVLAQASERDAATLNAVLLRTTGSERSAVMDRLEAQRGAPVWQPPPESPSTDASGNTWQ
jgi:hypothetical protein